MGLTSRRITSYNVCYTKLLRAQFFGEELGGSQPLRHAVAVLPGAEGKEPGRFAQTVTTYRPGFDAETADKIADRGTQSHLPDDQGAVLIVNRIVEVGTPEDLGQILAEEIFV